MKYALLGSGRLARHLKFYLETLNLPFATWSRRSSPHPQDSLQETVSDATHVLLAVSDHAISELRAHLPNGPTYVHFSGALSVPGVSSAHPLMTFGDRLESSEWYRAIPFVVEEGQTFFELLPGLPNPSYPLPTGAKSLYHALCSLAGNSTFLLWKAIGDRFENELALPRSLLNPYLHQVVSNASLSGEKNFTGPVARGDWSVVRRHFEALKDDQELVGAYRSYLNLAASRGIALPKEFL